MKTNIIGYPRIGEKRELKKLIENYFKNDISKEILLEEAKSLRIIHWNSQKENGIDYISSNDFSFYDTFLDTAILFGAYSKEYKDLGLDFLDTYFALAKGFQSDEKSIKALPMKKWFNTNYHYLVPEINEETNFELNLDKITSEFIEAKNIGIITKPVIIGPLTFLKLSNVKGNYKDYLNKLLPLYEELLAKLKDIGVEFVQVDEPILVTDLKEEDVRTFKNIYSKLLGTNINLILQTYFGHIEDVYNEIISLDFYGLGLDLVEGVKNIELVEKYGWNDNTIFFAGVISGKNIWKSNYAEVLGKFNRIKKIINEDKIVLGTSCSLLHVPYSLQNEFKLEEKFKEQLSFAKEKLIELKELKEILEVDNVQSSSLYVKNIGIIRKKIEIEDFYFKDINDKISKLKDEDFERKESFEERIKIQNKKFNLPILPTTTIGSFPQTNEIRKIRSQYKKGIISEIEYESFIKKKTEEVIQLQENIGLDVLVHGEFERNDMVEYFGEHLKGFLFTENGWVQSYGHRCVKPPIIFGDVKRESSITVKWSTFANSKTKKYMKGMLTGPITIQNWSFVREDISLKEIAYQIALAIAEEVEELERNNIEIIQIDEAALREKIPLRVSERKDYLDWAVKAFRLTNSKVKSSTQIHTHMCYSEFKDIIESIKELDADVITIESAKSDLEMLDVLKCSCYDKEVGPGIYDIHSHRVPSVEEFKNNILSIINKLPDNNIWINPDCGLKTRGEYETILSLKNMVTATKEIREKFIKA